MRPLVLHPDRILPAEPAPREIARELYSAAELPIVSPHGHTDPSCSPSMRLLVLPPAWCYARPHVLRMRYSRRVALEAVGFGEGGRDADPRVALRLFARVIPPILRHALRVLARLASGEAWGSTCDWKPERRTVLRVDHRGSGDRCLPPARCSTVSTRRPIGISARGDGQFAGSMGSPQELAGFVMHLPHSRKPALWIGNSSCGGDGEYPAGAACPGRRISNVFPVSAPRMAVWPPG